MAPVTPLPQHTPHCYTCLLRACKGSMTSHGNSWSQSMNPEQGTPFLTYRGKGRGPSELPHRWNSSSAPRRDSTEPRPRGCSVLGEPPQALPSF